MSLDCSMQQHSIFHSRISLTSAYVSWVKYAVAYYNQGICSCIHVKYVSGKCWCHYLWNTRAYVYLKYVSEICEWNMLMRITCEMCEGNVRVKCAMRITCEIREMCDAYYVWNTWNVHISHVYMYLLLVSSLVYTSAR